MAKSKAYVRRQEALADWLEDYHGGSDRHPHRVAAADLLKFLTAQGLAIVEVN